MTKKDKILLYVRIIGGVAAIFWGVYSNIANIFELPTLGDWRWGLFIGNLVFIALVVWHIHSLGKKIYKAERITLSTGKEISRQDKELLHAYINVKNDEDWDLVDCYARIKRILVESDEQWLDMTANINPNSANLTWPAFKREEVKIVRRNSVGRINIAKTIPNNFAFIFEDGDKPAFQFMSFGYYVEIEVNGIINGRAIEEKVLRGYLHYVKLIPIQDRPPEIYTGLYIEVTNNEPENAAHRLM